MIKHLIHHGNSRALVIDRSLLQAAGLDEDSALFQITIDPNGGLIIQSIKPTHKELNDKAFREVLKENDTLMKRLAKR